LNEPGLSLTKVTVPSGIVGLLEVSVTVAVQIVILPRSTDPGLHERDVVVEWAEVGVVTKRVNIPAEIPV